MARQNKSTSFCSGPPLRLASLACATAQNKTLSNCFGVNLQKRCYTNEGSDFNAVLGFAEKLMEGQNTVVRSNALTLIGQKEQEWARLVGPIIQYQKEASQLSLSLSSVNETLNDYKLYADLRGNICVRELTRNALEDLSRALLALKETGTFQVDRARYPEYLMHLQRTLRYCKTLAVAVVDEVEEFWAQTTGADILLTTRPDSQRVFVFKTQETMAKYFEAVVRHSSKYQVFVTSIREFTKAGTPYGVKLDFSIITDMTSGHQVTATYDGTERNIQFTASPAILRNHSRAFERIVSRAQRVLPDSNTLEDCEDLKSKVFVRRKEDGLHHSDVIPIERYDTYEEEHPFYLEMHECMLDQFRAQVQSGAGRLDVLEIGAGTGHFTKRVAQQPFAGLRFRAIEPDPAAMEYLQRKVRGLGVDVVEANFLEYDPPASPTSFSCFSEHHIRPEQKDTYFRNIANNVREGGFFIVGDEFLRSFNPRDLADYDKALEAYHAFIIAEAKKRHCWELVKLEEAALESGRSRSQNRVDFKTSLNEYLTGIRTFGFEAVFQYCISPEAVSPTVGGMYVLVFKRTASAQV